MCRETFEKKLNFGFGWSVVALRLKQETMFS